MAFLAERNQVGVRRFGTACNIPNDPKAHLMYYLSCVSTVLEIEDRVPNSLTNFRHYYLLSEDEIDRLLAHCILFSPDILDGKCFFETQTQAGPHGNTFLELSAVRNTMLVTGSLVIGGQRRNVTKVMTHSRNWMTMHYIEPLGSLLESRLEQRRRIRNVTPSPAPPRYESSSCNLL